MAAPWAAGAQARILGEIHGQQTVNVMHLGTNSIISDPTQVNLLLQQLVEALIDCARTTLLPAVSADWRLVSCDAKTIFPTVSDPVIATANAGEIGELSPTSVSFSASLLHIRTGIGGRRGRGRLFLPPAGESEIAASSIDPATVLLIAAFAACLVTKFSTPSATTTWRLGVLSTTILKTAGATFDDAFQQAIQLTPAINVAVMRSRKVGRGS